MRKLINILAKAFLRHLAPSNRLALFFQLAEDLNIRSVLVSGDNGHIFGPVDDRVVLGNYISHGTWAPEILNFIKGRLSKGGTFVDIGANIGLFTVPVAKMDDVSRVISFEPDPVNYRNLKLNIDFNGVASKVDAHNLALFDRKTTLSFELSPDNFGDHRLRSDGGASNGDDYGEAGRKLISVSADRVDNCVSDLASVAHPLVIKMDVQGAESAVFGGGPVVFGAADVLIVEYWPYGIRRLGGDPREFLDALAAVFPYIASVPEDEAVTTDMFMPSSRALELLKNLAASAGTEHVDLICVHRMS